MTCTRRIDLKRLARVGALCAVVSAPFAASAPASAAAEIKTQAPCVSASGYCVAFDEDDTIPLVRSITFSAPSAGTAAVRFVGSMECINDFLRPAVVDLVSQIVTDAAAVPDVNGDGGLRHAIVFTAGPDPLAGGMDKADTFNLKSTRVVPIAAKGNRQFFFKIGRLRMDSGTACFVYNASFSIVFVP